MLDPDQGLRDGVCQRHHVLQGGQRHPRRSQRGRLQRVGQARKKDMISASDVYPVFAPDSWLRPHCVTCWEQ